ncbi:MAG: helical backbone metal receptor [Methanocorpusculum sp.]|nr:helical backbone metal receptor [Methanocorpusculum sp.]
MTRAVIPALIVILTAGLLIGGAAAAEWTPVTVTDTDGNQITISEQPDKIISLAPACTEIIYAVGAGDRVIGDTDYCNYPEAAKHVEKIGGFSTISNERIITLCDENTVIFANPKNNGKETIDYLKEHGCTVIAADIRSVDDIYTAIDLIGTTVGCKENADKLNREIKASIDRISAKVADAKASGNVPTVMHIIQTNPYYVSGKNTFQDELITIAGGRNAFSDVDGWGTVTLERLLVTDPDIIITDAVNDSGSFNNISLADAIKNEPRLAALSAVKNNKVYSINQDIFNRGGPRIVEALDMLAKILHPEIFGAAPTQTPAKTPGFGAVSVLCGVLGAALLLRRKE